MRPNALLLVVFLLPAAAWAGPPPSTPPGLQESVRFHQVPERLELPALDVAKLRAEDRERAFRREPPRYAVKKAVATISPKANGDWETLADGTRVWRYEIHAKNAVSVQPGFTRFRLPEGAALYAHGNEGKRVRGPYTHEHNARHGELWVPIIEGDRATIELVLEPGVSRDAVQLSMTRVLHGYEPFWKRETRPKATNSCNVDVACPEASGWEDPIASAARMTVVVANRAVNCSGQMVNDTAYSGRPLFLTANHCQVRESNAPTVNVYWNYEHPECREIGDSPTPRTERSTQASLDDVQTGARLLSRYVSSDFTLLELSHDPDPEWGVFWTGWDRRDGAFGQAVGIHHPQGEEKRISFEDNQLDIVDGSVLTEGANPPLQPNEAVPRSHFLVNDWDLGVTEHGSSGSGLWNGQQRLVGQLHAGGQHQCNDNDFDYYGRFWRSWEGGGTVDSSLEPWLDPLGTGPEKLDGRDGDCNAPGVAIADNVSGPTAGEAFTLSANGGAGARFLWDVDGDGIMDAEGREVSVRFADAGEREVRVTASTPGKACGKTVSKTLTVTAPDLQVANEIEPFEIQGDGDHLMEPGERWGIRIALKNEGGARAVNPRAVFVSADGEADTRGPDGFGYTAAGSRSSPTCAYQFVNIGGTNEVAFNPVDQRFPGNDDGGSDGIPVNNFQFYGESVNAMVMSSNGYLVPSVNRDGGDFDNDCPLPAPVDADFGSNRSIGQARLAAYHDDLVTPRAFQERQDPCQRPGDVPGGSGACQIFQWNNVDVLDPTTYQFPGGPEAFDIDRFRFQAILYEGTNEIVYQYGPTAPTTSTTPTVGIQDKRADDGLTWGCADNADSQPPVRPSPNSAVCFFDPKAQPPGFDPEAVNLLTPALAYSNIPAGRTKLARLEFEIDADAECGSQFALGLHGVVHDGGFTPGPGTFFTARVGGENARCDANVKSAAPKADIDFRPGMYFNPARDGHGADIHTGGDQAFLVWFTYGPDRQPVWYLAQGAYRNDQIVADLLRFTEDKANAPEVVGEVIVTFLDETTALFNWTLNGEPGGEVFRFLKFADEPPPNQRTGHWFPPSQAGWGMTFNTQGSIEVGVVYFYDDQGRPVWALGQKDAPNQKIINLDQFKGVCPGCDWTAQSARAAGSLERSFDDARNGTVKTNIGLEAPLEGNWNRGEVPIQILSDPVQ